MAMTRFFDGPAKGKTLMLKRTPIFLRVVTDGKTWDALNDLTDTIGPKETAFAYKIKGQAGWCHIRASKGDGGFYGMATYAMITDQPTQATMRDNAKWVAWVQAKADAAKAAGESLEPTTEP